MATKVRLKSVVEEISTILPPVCLVRSSRKDERPDPGLRVTTRIQCADWFDVRDEALKAHATQIDPTSRWFLVPRDIQREVWPTEDYELVRSLVDSTVPEDDLFAGVHEHVAVKPGV